MRVGFRWLLVPVLGMVLALAGWSLFGRFGKDPRERTARGSVQAPLFDPGDRPTTIFLKALDIGTGKLVNQGAVIRLSRDRVNQARQAVLAFLNGPREGRVQVPVPEGLALNDLYWTAAGMAVVDLGTTGVRRDSVGFLDEALLVRCLIDTLSGNFFEIKQVRILVDGQEAPSLFGHYALGTSEAGAPARPDAAQP